MGRQAWFISKIKNTELVHWLKNLGKSGRFTIAYEIQINKTIKKNRQQFATFISLPVHEQLDSFYTLYREAGTLEINCKNIKEKLENKYTLSYLFQGFSQMITALSFLHNSKFTDEEGNDHIGIIHNDIKTR